MTAATPTPAPVPSPAPDAALAAAAPATPAPIAHVDGQVGAHGRRVARPAMSHAFWWGLFAVGGMTAALLLPIHILVQGILGPLGMVPVVGKVFDASGAIDARASYESLSGLVANPLVKLYLFVLIALPLFHAAHRLRYVAVDLGLKAAHGTAGLVLYAAAALGAIATAFVLATVP